MPEKNITLDEIEQKIRDNFKKKFVKEREEDDDGPTVMDGPYIVEIMPFDKRVIAKDKGKIMLAKFNEAYDFDSDLIEAEIVEKSNGKENNDMSDDEKESMEAVKDLADAK